MIITEKSKNKKGITVRKLQKECYLMFLIYNNFQKNDIKFLLYLLQKGNIFLLFYLFKHLFEKKKTYNWNKIKNEGSIFILYSFQGI